MFDLEKSIAAWRKEMIRAGIKNAGALDELENHLREDVVQQIRAGLPADVAFANAAKRIGPAEQLRKEFAKMSRTHPKWLKKLKYSIAIFLGLRPPVLFSGLIAIPELECFTANGRESLLHARTEAMELHHDFIGTEHVLLGLFQKENSIAREVLNGLGVGQEKIRDEIVKWVPEGPQGRPLDEVPYTPRARQALALAATEAKAQHHTDIGAEHILLGLLREGGGVAALVLKNLGVDLEKTRREILRASN